MLEKLGNIIRRSEDFAEFKAKAERGDIARTIMLISKDSDYSFEFARLLSCLIFDGGDLGESENYHKVRSQGHPDLKVYPTKER